MDNYYKYYKKENKNKSSKLLTKILLSIIFLLISVIYIKLSPDNKEFYKKIFLTDNLSFTKINDFYQKYFGNVIPIESNDTQTPVFNEKLEYKNIDNYLNGKIITVEENTTIPTLESGIVVFIGEKEGYGNTIIVQGNDGVDIWYGNIESTSLNLYDYIKKNTPLGITKENYFYLILMKDNQYLNYEEYFKD